MEPTSEALLFDALTGAAGPTNALGVRVDSSVVGARFAAVVAQAEASVGAFFGVELGSGAERVRALDGILRGLHEAGWDSASADVDLFTLQFGALLMAEVVQRCGGEPVFRSEHELTHASIWFATARVELFPFHRAFKTVTRGPAEPLVELYEIARQLAALRTPSA